MNIEMDAEAFKAYRDIEKQVVALTASNKALELKCADLAGDLDAECRVSQRLLKAVERLTEVKNAFRRDATKVEVDNKRLREALEKYGKHQGLCRIDARNPCNCGLKQALERRE